VYIYYTKITHSCAKLEHINQLKLFNKVIMGKMKKWVGKLSLSQKGRASPLGVACAAFLSSWLGVLRQLRCVQSSFANLGAR
jgi:hypothetical protein